MKSETTSHGQQIAKWRISLIFGRVQTPMGNNKKKKGRKLEEEQKRETTIKLLLQGPDPHHR